VPVGTGDEVEAIIKKTNPAADFAVVSNPEFLREGAAIGDFKRPDRIVIGTNDERAREVMRQLYRPLSLNQTPMVFTERRTSELIKYAANALPRDQDHLHQRDRRSCEALGANVQEVAKRHRPRQPHRPQIPARRPRLWRLVLPEGHAGADENRARQRRADRAHRSTVRVNSARKQKMAQKIIEAVGGSVAGKTIAVLGLTFKPNTDDMRDAPALEIVPTLQAEGAKVRAFDPEGMNEAKHMLKDVAFATGPYDCVQGADAVVIITEWDQFRALDLDRIKDALKSPTLIDLRNIYRPDEMRAKGFQYVSVGRA
jgi:UDPglucose 6-dehydrogenase